MGADPIPGRPGSRPGARAPTPTRMNQAAQAIGRRTVSWDPERGVLTVGERSVALTCAPGDNECVLRTYLHLVADQRDVRLDRSVVLRRDDVLVLAELLDLDDVRLEHQLTAILRISGDEAKALRRDLLRHRVTAAAMGVGLLAVVPLAGAAAADDAPAFTDPAPAVCVVPSPDSLDHEVEVPAVEVPAVEATPTDEIAPPVVPVAEPPAAAASAPTTVAPAQRPHEPEPEAATEIGWSETHERDPDAVAPEGVEIGDAMVLERDLPGE